MGDKSKELIKNNINVVMIEPQPICLDHLKKMYSDNSLVNIVPMGLGRSAQKMEMSINSNQPVISTLSEHWKTGRFSNSKWDKKIIIDIFLGPPILNLPNLSRAFLIDSSKSILLLDPPPPQGLLLFPPEPQGLLSLLFLFQFIYLLIKYFKLLSLFKLITKYI